MLFFPILNYSYYNSYYGKMRHYTDSGFSLLLFNSKGIEDGYVAILGILAWAHLITGIVMLVKSILMFKSTPSSTKPYIIVIVSIGTSSLLYLIEGLVASSISISNNSYNVQSLTWIPFILILGLSVLAIIYLDSYKKQPIYESQQSSTSNASTNLTANTTNQIIPQEDGCIYTIDGEVKLLKVYNDYVTTENKVNARAILTNNIFSGNKKIFYQNMIGVQFKESSTFVLGYIQFETANTFSKDNFNSENSVTFSHVKVPNEYAKQVVDFVEKKIIGAKTPTSVTQTPSTADELIKYKNLLDIGAISQEEYDKKKNELLNK